MNDRLLTRSVDNKFVNYLQHVHNDPVRCSLWVAVWLLYALFCFLECGFSESLNNCLKKNHLVIFGYQFSLIKEIPTT